MKQAKKQGPYVQAQSELEDTVASLATANGFSMATRNPNFGKGSWVTWRRQFGWRADELRLLFLWQGRSGFRAVYADLSTEIILPSRSISVDGYPAAGIARNSSKEQRIREADAHAPAKVIKTLRSDIMLAIAWLDRTYSTPAAAAELIMSADRNGVGVGTPVHQAVLEHLQGIANALRSDGGERDPL